MSFSYFIAAGIYFFDGAKKTKFRLFLTKKGERICLAYYSAPVFSYPFAYRRRPSSLTIALYLSMSIF